MPILQNKTKERKRRQDVNEEKWGMTRIGRGNGTKHITALHEGHIRPDRKKKLHN
jgi:hypothetical protein